MIDSLQYEEIVIFHLSMAQFEAHLDRLLHVDPDTHTPATTTESDSA